MLDDAWAELIRNELAAAPSSARFLLVSRSTQMLNLNLLLLRLCASERSERIIYVSVDRPHTYIEFLMKRNGFPLDGIVFVDAVTTLTQEKLEKEPSRVTFRSGAFCPRLFSDTFNRAFLPGGTEKRFVDLGEMNSVIFDNIGVLSYYSGSERLTNIMGEVEGLFKQVPHLRGLFPIDAEAHGAIAERLKGLCNRVVRVEG